MLQSAKSWEKIGTGYLGDIHEDGKSLALCQSLPFKSRPITQPYTRGGTLKMRTDLEREHLLNTLALHLVNDIGECSIYMVERLRFLAYAMKTSEHITPAMDEEVLNRVRRLKAVRRARMSVPADPAIGSSLIQNASTARVSDA